MEREKSIPWTKESVLILICRYRQHQSLYDAKNNLYHNKNYRNRALQDIVEQLLDCHPEITIADVKTKINYLRAQYGREQQKVHDSKKNASSDEVIYVPTAYWFEHLSFLTDYIRHRKYKNAIDANSEVSMTSEVSIASEAFDESSLSDVEEVAMPPTKKRKMVQQSDDVLEVNTSNIDYLLNTANELLTEIAKTNKPEERYNDSLIMFLKENIKIVTDPVLKDDMAQKIITVVLEYKKKQRNLK